MLLLLFFRGGSPVPAAPAPSATPASSASGGWFPQVRYKTRKQVRDERIALGMFAAQPVEAAVAAIAALPVKRKTITLESLIGKPAALRADDVDRIEIEIAVQRENRRRRLREEDELLLLMD